MRHKNTFIMAAIAALLLGYVYFFEIRGSEERAEAERVAERLLQFESANVTGLTIEGADGTVVLRRSEDAWRVTEPYDLAADDASVSSIVNQLQTANHERLIDEQPDDRSRFGLGEPEVSVMLELDDGSTRRLAIGAGTPVGFEVFVRPGEGDAIYTTAASLKDTVNKSLFDLRDRSILNFVDAEVARLEIDTPAVDASLRRGADLGDGIDRWELAAPLEASADGSTVTSLLSRLRTDKAVAYPADQPTDEQLTEYGLVDPDIVVAVWTDDDAAQTLHIGAESEEPAGRYARRLGSDAVFVVSASFVEALPDDIDTLRNRTVVELTRDRVDSIEVARDGETIQMQKDGIDWRVITPRALDGDPSTIATMLSSTLNLRAVEFADGTPEESRFGFADPYLRLTFGLEPLPAPTPEAESATEPEAVVVLVGGETELDPEPAEGEEEEPEPIAARYVAVEGQSTVYVVEADDLADLDVDLFAVRSKTLVSFSQSELDRIEIDSDGATYRLDKGEDGSWVVAGPSTPADLDSAVNDLLWSLNYLDFEGIAAEWEGEPDVDLGTYGLAEPSLRIRVYIGDSGHGDVSIGTDVAAELLEDSPPFAPTTQTWALVEGHRGVFRIDAKLRDNGRALVAEIS